MPDTFAKRTSTFFKGQLFLLYVTYFWATWGNRMWTFAFGLYLVILAEKQLRLTAIYGFLMGVAVLLFGGFIGSWVDRTNRRKAIRTSILLQKSTVIMCSIAICGKFIFCDAIDTLAGGALHHVLHAIVIALAIAAELATMSYQRIELEKDWFVVITGGDESKLANLNAGTRIVDQITNVATPIVTGLIMASVSKIVAGFVIIGWHMVAVVVEIVLTSRIYAMTPSMQHKSSHQVNKVVNNHAGNDTANTEENSLMDNSPLKSTASPKQDNANKSCNCCQCISTLWVGWRVYARQTVVLAGVSLALLYMTVLGFDGITTGYIYANGLSEGIIGIATALSSVAGVLGAIIYTQLHRCLGLERTGLVSFTFQITCLCFCVFSIWMRGSPFQPDALWKQYSSSYPMETNGVYTESPNITDNHTTKSYDPDDSSPVTPSIVLFVAAIVTSRMGLWISDLVICQLQQENVPESERGIVNGVQNSLNNVMDMLKFILVIFLPQIETFGYLIILSFTFVLFGVLTFYMHAFKASGYSVVRCCTGKTSYKKNNVIVTYVTTNVNE